MCWRGAGGIVGNPAKAFDLQESGDALGVTLLGGLRFVPKAGR